MRCSFPGFRCGYYTATIYQLIVAVTMLWLSRFAYYTYNAEVIGEITCEEWSRILWGGLRFDLCAAAYFNLLFIAMRFLPFGFVSRRGWILASNIVFGVCNSVMLALNVADVAFSPFIGGRMRWSTLAGAFGDSNMVGIIISYFHDYWWTYLLALVLIAVMLSVAYLPVISGRFVCVGRRWLTLLLRILIFLAASIAVLACIRGDFSKSDRPLSIADAMRYGLNTRIDLILNTPFTIIRSINSAAALEKVEYFNDKELCEMRHDRYEFTTADSLPGIASQKGKNVVVIVLESGAQLWIDRLNIVSGDSARKLTPFLDSIAARSLVCRNVMATGIVSPNGITAVFCGFPSFEPMFHTVSPYNGNKIDTAVNLLASEGYSSKFYFGGAPTSYYVVPSALASGFSDVVTRKEYDDDSDFDGKWGIFDHAMGAYAARDLSALPQPFIAGWFTINAHAPFVVPDRWQADGYLSEPKTPQRGIEYTDRALRHFFNIAKEQPWYENTVFVITGDHGNREMKSTKYDTPYIKYHIPFIVYTPDGTVPPIEVKGRVMSQFDITPTLLHLMGYDKRFMSLGTDLFDPLRPHYGLSGVNGRLMVTGLKYVVMTDMKASEVNEVYDITADQSLSNPLTDYDTREVTVMMRWAKAFMQDYTTRMISNRMSVMTDSIP